MNSQLLLRNPAYSSFQTKVYAWSINYTKQLDLAFAPHPCTVRRQFTISQVRVNLNFVTVEKT